MVNSLVSKSQKEPSDSKSLPNKSKPKIREQGVDFNTIIKAVIHGLFFLPKYSIPPQR